MKMKVGINGFGRIGKALFLQLLSHPTFEITAINAIHLDTDSFESYVKHDSVHHYEKDFRIEKIALDQIIVSNGSSTHHIRLFREKDASKISWNCDLLFEASGAYLTQKKCQEHRNVPYIIITAPAKDSSIPTFVYGVNEDLYSTCGSSIISNASCTTNCITPFLKAVHTKYSITSASFTTIHASTSSQYVLDTPIVNTKSARSSRSIFNNLIPATTGASSAVAAVIPELEGRIHGMAIRVPTNNVSVVDITLETEKVCMKADLLEHFKKCGGKVIRVEEEELVSTDFMTTCEPTIVDAPSFIQLSDRKIKLLIWYDNEWSYAAQTIRMAEVIHTHASKSRFLRKVPYGTFQGKSVLIRVDFNLPIKDGVITDDFRITSTLPTFERILADKPRRIVIATHLGRPKGNGYEDVSRSICSMNEVNRAKIEKYTTRQLVECISKHLRHKVHFLKDGISQSSLEEIARNEHEQYAYSLYEMDEHISPKLFEKSAEPYIYLLENVRFHCEETDPKYAETERYQIWNQLGDRFIFAAFGCAHRDHLTINGFKDRNHQYYDLLVEHELNALNTFNTFNTSNPRILAILGGAKIDDKLPLCEALSKKVNHIYLGGGIVNSYIYHPDHRAFIDILLHTHKASLMFDGYGNINLNASFAKYIYDYQTLGNHYYDIGTKSLHELYALIDQHDIIFWNGTLGVVEHELYSSGSASLLQYLLQSKKKIIVGGGDTAGFVNQYILDKKIDLSNIDIHICTGGGATIEYIIHGKLVGIHC